MSCDREFE